VVSDGDLLLLLLQGLVHLLPLLTIPGIKSFSQKCDFKFCSMVPVPVFNSILAKLRAISFTTIQIFNHIFDPL
jgi:hypothetical protein